MGKNDEGAAVKLGTAAGFTSKYYCARVLGPNAIPGSNGRCGPTNGPQCPSCKRFQVAAMKNDEDGDIQLEYRREVPHNAGRPSSRSRLSKDVIEQAWHNKTHANGDVQLEHRRELAHNEGPRRHAVQAKNDEGAAVKLGTWAGFTSKYYCARVLGPNAIPGSNGRCGPTNGPQCPSCKRFQVAAMKNDEDGDIHLAHRREVPHNAGIVQCRHNQTSVRSLIRWTPLQTCAPPPMKVPPLNSAQPLALRASTIVPVFSAQMQFQAQTVAVAPPMDHNVHRVNASRWQP